jgi:2-polyprenyl-6-methoxyphenol hydroxylase-like FAD-dependent oxidoreductase
LFPPTGALLLGDAFNMRHPLTGGGMTVALSDTRLLCEMLQPLPSFEDAIATARSTAEFYTKRKPVSATINTLANALYKVRRLLLQLYLLHCCCHCMLVLQLACCLIHCHQLALLHAPG